MDSCIFCVRHSDGLNGLACELKGGRTRGRGEAGEDSCTRCRPRLTRSSAPPIFGVFGLWERTFDAQSTLLATTQRQAMQAAAAAMRTQGRAGAEDGAQREPPPLADAATGVGITALPSFEALGAFAAGGASESQEPGPTQMDLDVYGATPTTQAAAPATVVLPPQVPKRVDLDPLRVRPTQHGVRGACICSSSQGGGRCFFYSKVDGLDQIGP